MLYGKMISILFGLPNNKKMDYNHIKEFNRLYVFNIGLVLFLSYIIEILSNLGNDNLFNLIILGLLTLPILNTLFRMLLVRYEKNTYREFAIIWIKKTYKIIIITIVINFLIRNLL